MTTHAMPDGAPGPNLHADMLATGRRGSSDLTPPFTAVSVYEAIYQRRSTWVFLDRPIPRDAVERMLEAAVWAQNHKLTEPWRFIIVEKGSATSRTVSELAAAHIVKVSGNPAYLARGRRKFGDPPVVIWVFCVPGPSEHVTMENHAAVSGAIQNLSLAAVAEGLGIGWDNGAAAHAPGIRDALGAEPAWLSMGALLIGNPLKSAPSQRTPSTAFTRWAD